MYGNCLSNNYPLSENARVYLETWPRMKDGIACELLDATAELEYLTIL